MALSVPKAPGVAQMLKDGARVSKINGILLKIPCDSENLLGFFVKFWCLYVRRSVGAHVNISIVKCGVLRLKIIPISQILNIFKCLKVEGLMFKT